MSPLTIEVATDKTDGICIIHLSGILEYDCVPGISVKVEELLAQGEKKLLIDMTNVTHANSKGMGAIISIMRMCAENQAKFVLWNIQETALRVFKTTKLDSIITICDGALADAKQTLSTLSTKPAKL